MSDILGAATLETTSKRGAAFIRCALKILAHIDAYTVPQYGDEGDDQVTHYTAEECFKQAEKYLARRKSQQREDQRFVDPLKAIHYIQMGADKLLEEQK